MWVLLSLVFAIWQGVQSTLFDTVGISTNRRPCMFHMPTWEGLSFIPTFSSHSLLSLEVVGWRMNRRQLWEKHLQTKIVCFHPNLGWFWGRLSPQPTSTSCLLNKCKTILFFHFIGLIVRLIITSIIITSVKTHRHTMLTCLWVAYKVASSSSKVFPWSSANKFFPVCNKVP